MNNRPGLCVFLILLLSAVPRDAEGQTIHSNPDFAQKQSHHELSGGFDLKAGQEMMAERLKELHELHQLQGQVQGLLGDPDFREKLQSQFSEDQRRQILEKILKGDGLSRDGNWGRLLNEAGSDKHKMDDLLRRLAESVGKKQASSSSGPAPAPRDPSIASPAGASPSSSETIAPPTPELKSSLWGRLQEGAADWLSELADDLAGDMTGALADLGATEEGAPLADLMRSLKGANASDAWADWAAFVSDYLPDVDAWMNETGSAWADVRSVFRGAPVPSLPTFGGGPPPVSGGAPAGSDGWGAGSLVLLALGVFVLLLWKVARNSASKTSGAAEEWRLGPWPVAPGAVSTGAELIRAFEYLALLRLGPSAGTHNHRDLAGRLGEGDGPDPARRRQAADLLAWLYEQARYAPAGGRLSPDELAEARHALCLLAGVTTV